MVFSPGGDWIERVNITITDQLDIPFTFTSPTPVVKASIPGSPNTWIKAGYFTQFFEHLNFGRVEYSRRVLSRLNQSIYFQFPILILDSANFIFGYQLHFQPMNWINSLTLQIFEPTMPLYFEPTLTIPNSTTSISTTVAATAISTTLLAANANRKKFKIANTSNQDLYIDFDATTSLTDYSIKVPKVSASGFISTYEDDGFTGQVSGIWQATGTGAALVREFS